MVFYSFTSGMGAFLVFLYFFARVYLPASGPAVVTGVAYSTPPFLPSIFIAHKVQQSHCSSIFHRVLLSHALAFSASQFVREKTSPRTYTSMHEGAQKKKKSTPSYQIFFSPFQRGEGGTKTHRPHYAHIKKPHSKSSFIKGQ